MATRSYWLLRLARPAGERMGLGWASDCELGLVIR
jgi:hypothetical protein